jgi:hypothetical protein
MTAVVTVVEIVPMAYVVRRMLHKCIVCEHFLSCFDAILFNGKDANAVIGCRFIVFDTGGRINRLYVLNLLERPVDYLLCVA